jgi:hypothetical protein
VPVDNRKSTFFRFSLNDDPLPAPVWSGVQTCAAGAIGRSGASVWWQPVPGIVFAIELQPAKIGRSITNEDGEQNW